MDRRVKERLVGASILVVLIVLIVPELLSGPKHAAAPSVPAAPVHSYTIDVESRAPAPAQAQAPASAATEAISVAPPAADLHSGEAVPKFDRAWSVQLGSFAREDNADAFARELRSKGFAAYVSSSADHASRYRVRVGPFADRETALRLESQLKSRKLAATLVAPGN
jgi:DedD protein